MSANNRCLFEEGQRHADPSGRLDGENGLCIKWQTLVGGQSDGVQIVRLSNSAMSVTVCPTRGMGVLEADVEGIRVGWDSPVKGPVHPSLVDLSGRNSLGWLDGFSELLCRCGLSFNGPPGIDEGAASPIESQLTLHGRIANTPARTVEVGFDTSTGAAWVSGACWESTLFGPNLEMVSRVSLAPGETSFSVADTVTNHASTPTDLQLLYHINVGPPFLEAGSHFLTAHREMSPRDARSAEGIDTSEDYLGPTPGYVEQVYFFDVLAGEDNQATALLSNKAGDLGVSVIYDRAQLPCLIQWKCTQPLADGYVTGIEPATGFPNPKSFERQCGRVISLAAGASYEAGLTLAVHTSADAIATAQQGIREHQRDIVPTIRPKPSPPYAPA